MLKANLVHVQTLRASAGSSIEVFTIGKRPKPVLQTDAAQPVKAARAGASIVPRSPHKTQHPRPQPYPADKLNRGRPPRRRASGAKSDAPERSPESMQSTLRRSTTSISGPPSTLPEQPSMQSLRSELETTRERPSSMMQSLRNELEATHNELARSKHDVQRYAERLRYMERALRDASDRLFQRDREIDELKRERSRLLSERERERAQHQQRLERAQAAAVQVQRASTASSRSSRTSYDSDQETVLVLDDASASARRRNRSVPPAQRSRSTSTLTLTKSIEVKPVPGLEVFLSKTDRWSGAQVIEAVQDLNSEIIQLAAAVVEVTTVAPAPVATASRLAHARKAIAARLGPAFAQVLAGRDHTHDPTLVQLALQTCLATCTARLLSVFCIGLPEMPNELFEQLYDDVRETEPQATSSRWRALTLQHIRSLNPQLEGTAANEFVTQLLRAWTEVFVLCGCASVEGVSLLALDALRARFGRQCARIALRACKLARVVNEEIMSTNFGLLFVPHGARFAAERMQNAYAGAAAPVGPVMGTTELGLQCLTRARAQGGDGDETVARTLLLPKVVLETVPQVLDLNMST